MDHRFQQLKHPVLPGQAAFRPNASKPSAAFTDVLHDRQAIKLSKHARERLDERGVTFSQAEWQTISDKMSEARRKGVTDALVPTNDAALLASTKNNTVITGMHKTEAASPIFTTINGTILIASKADL